MNKHSKKALLIFAATLGVFVGLCFIYIFSINNQTAEKYRAELDKKIEETYPEFAAQREDFYDLTGIDSIVEKNEKLRNEAFNEFYSALSLSDKMKVNERIDNAFNNIYASMDMIDEQLTQLTDMFEEASDRELSKFQEDFQTKSDSLTANIDQIFQDLLKQP